MTVGKFEYRHDLVRMSSAKNLAVQLYTAAGFSGHGFQHSPATGKVMSEIILDGASRTVDVSMLDPERFAEGRMIRELNVV